MKKYDGMKKSGHFQINDQTIIGEFSLNGSNTILELFSQKPFDLTHIEDTSVLGTFLDLRKVSLLECISYGSGRGIHPSGSYQSARIFPHYVVLGDTHLKATDQRINEVHFTIDDITSLFHDVDAFGSVLDPASLIGQIVEAKAAKRGRKIPTGPNAHILYFTGKQEIFTAETAIGRVCASNSPTLDLGSPKGLHLENEIPVSIIFPEALAFSEVISRVMTLLQFLEITLGRPQNVLDLKLGLQDDDPERSLLLDVYWCLAPQRRGTGRERAPHPRDVLVSGAGAPDKLAGILTNWLSRSSDWQSSRSRFSQGFSKQHHYDIDRLVGAANMFDIIPNSALPSAVPVSAELKKAQSLSRDLFRELPKSIERDSILAALGRIGKNNLKQKVRHRAKFLTDASSDQFPELPLVLDEAVNCRNFFVHGSESRFDYSKNFGGVIFLTDTLEFVFAASDFIESGWDFKTWSQASSTMSHPFAAYRSSYLEHLQELKGLLPAT